MCRSDSASMHAMPLRIPWRDDSDEESTERSQKPKEKYFFYFDLSLNCLLYLLSLFDQNLVEALGDVSKADW
ncbi:hypothetical protein SORBI_3002G189750 [Sorghum bicolor]|uniref:Uncharacterized protein n=1 Tax=Sorghum bicolor TaxID=4558 RepID=A0A1W0W4V3_SORBI|nr:hypothetical protein SORBI_3002G189750 [Sorghum bicolor]